MYICMHAYLCIYVYMYWIYGVCECMWVLREILYSLIFQSSKFFRNI